MYKVHYLLDDIFGIMDFQLVFKTTISAPITAVTDLGLDRRKSIVNVTERDESQRLLQMC